MSPNYARSKYFGTTEGFDSWDIHESTATLAGVPLERVAINRNDGDFIVSLFARTPNYLGRAPRPGERYPDSAVLMVVDMRPGHWPDEALHLDREAIGSLLDELTDGKWSATHVARGAVS